MLAGEDLNVMTYVDGIDMRIAEIAEKQNELEGELLFLQEESKRVIGNNLSSLYDSEAAIKKIAENEGSKLVLVATTSSRTATAMASHITSLDNEQNRIYELLRVTEGLAEITKLAGALKIVNPENVSDCCHLLEEYHLLNSVLKQSFDERSENGDKLVPIVTRVSESTCQKLLDQLQGACPMDSKWNIDLCADLMTKLHAIQKKDVAINLLSHLLTKRLHFDFGEIHKQNAGPKEIFFAIVAGKRQDLFVKTIDWIKNVLFPKAGWLLRDGNGKVSIFKALFDFTDQASFELWKEIQSMRQYQKFFTSTSQKSGQNEGLDDLPIFDERINELTLLSRSIFASYAFHGLFAKELALSSPTPSNFDLTSFYPKSLAIIIGEIVQIYATLELKFLENAVKKMAKDMKKRNAGRLVSEPLSDILFFLGKILKRALGNVKEVQVIAKIMQECHKIIELHIILNLTAVPKFSNPAPNGEGIPDSLYLNSLNDQWAAYSMLKTTLLEIQTIIEDPCSTLFMSKQISLDTRSVKAWFANFGSKFVGFVESSFQDMRYDAEDTNDEDVEIFVGSLLDQIQRIISPIEDSILEEVRHQLFKRCVEFVLDEWESKIMISKMSDIGTIVFDRQVRLFGNSIADVIGIDDSKTLMRKMAQISAVLNCASIQEVSELAAKSPAGHWILRDSQIREILKLRVK